METKIKTYTGKFVNPFDMRDEDFDIEDIAHALSNLCRYTGHTKFFYSVAQHSVYVSQHFSLRYAKIGLLHDGAEAYINDLASPIRRHPQLAGYNQLERELLARLLRHFCGIVEVPEEVRDVDSIVFTTEAHQLFQSLDGFSFKHSPALFRIKEWTPAEAKKRFLDRYEAVKGFNLSNG